MQTVQSKRVGIYSGGFFCVLIGAILFGVLLGTVSYCFMDNNLLDKLGVLQADFMSARKNTGFGEILIKSLSSSTLYLLVIFILGFSAVSQPAQLGILLVRGMGFGVALSQLYSGYGKMGILYSAVLVLPCAMISSVALVVGAREAVGLSILYVKFSLSDRQQTGLLCSLKLYCAKFLVLEAVLSVGAIIDCVCTILMQRFVFSG